MNSRIADAHQGFRAVVILASWMACLGAVPAGGDPSSGPTNLTEPQAGRVKFGVVRQARATVRNVRGQAYLQNPRGDWQELRAGKILQAGDCVRTVDDSEVDLFLRQNGPVVRLCPKSLLCLDELSFREAGEETIITTRLDLQQGTLLTNVKKLAAGSRYEIKTTKGIVGPDGSSRIESP